MAVCCVVGAQSVCDAAKEQQEQQCSNSCRSPVAVQQQCTQQPSSSGSTSSGTSSGTHCSNGPLHSMHASKRETHAQPGAVIEPVLPITLLWLLLLSCCRYCCCLVCLLSQGECAALGQGWLPVCDVCQPPLHRLCHELGGAPAGPQRHKFPSGGNGRRHPVHTGTQGCAHLPHAER